MLASMYMHNTHRLLGITIVNYQSRECIEEVFNLSIRGSTPEMALLNCRRMSAMVDIVHTSYTT